MTPANASFAAAVQASFQAQSAMHLIRATMPVVEAGRTEIHLRGIGEVGLPLIGQD